MLTKAQQVELIELRKRSMTEMLKHEPNYQTMMARAALSGAIWTVLGTLYEDLQAAGEKMPEEFAPSISSDIPAAIDSAATAYLAADSHRPRAKWSLSSRERALGRELQHAMDERALMVAAYLEIARAYLLDRSTKTKGHLVPQNHSYPKSDLFNAETKAR